jgi:hypothetical protein
LPQLAAAEIVTPATLDPIAKRALEDALYDLHSRIFQGVDKDSFIDYVVDSEAQHTWIQLFRDDGGALGGYFAVHIYERVIDGRTVAIVRGEFGTLREHRGSNLMAAFFAERVLRYMAAHPLRRMYILASFVHPSSYSQLVRYHDEVWPREGAETPAAIRELMDSLGDAFGLDRVDPMNALVRKVGWLTSDSQADRAYWEGCDRPGVKFFLRENPDYGEGHGLLTLAPLTLGIVARGLSRYALARATSRIRKLAGRARAEIAGLLPTPTAGSSV